MTRNSSGHDESRDLKDWSEEEILELAQEKYSTEDKFIEGAGAVLITWCVFALFVDPLFLYIPFIKEDKKCFMLDPKIKIIALVLRSVLDLPFSLVNIMVVGTLSVYFIYNFMKMTASGRRANKKDDECDDDDTVMHKVVLEMKVAAVLTLATFPIPQIAILVFFPRMKGSRYLIGTKVLNSAIMLQYLLRAWPTYFFCKNLNKVQLDTKGGSSKDKQWPTFFFKNFIKVKVKLDTFQENFGGRRKWYFSKGKRWIPGAVNFALYILASYVFGALWYFFSILREIDCWIAACGKETGCEFSTFYCDSSDTTLRNITLVNDLCPINPSNPMIFDFGIFLGPIQSGLVRSTNIPKKFLQCFSWGLRNLSSFASNLNPSNYTWEILFVILVSISGLLLFIYLLGHLQTFMLAGTRAYRIRQKIQVLSPEIKFMISEYGLRGFFWRFVIENLVEERLEDDEDLVVENIFSILPGRLQELLKHYLLLATLKKLHTNTKVPRCQENDVLEKIMEYLEPKSYTTDSYIIREGEPLDKMIFITQGSVLMYSTNVVGHGGSGSSNAERLVKGDFYGKEVITAAFSSSSFPELPISTKTIKAYNKVEVFTIKVDHLQSVFSETHFNSTELPQPIDSTSVEITDDN